MILWISDERRIAVFITLAIFLPYLAVVAPLRCGGRTRAGLACRNDGYGWLIGCRHHRSDRLARIFGQDRDRRAASRFQPPRGPVAATGSVGLPTARSYGEPTRPRAIDMLTFAITALGTVAGWLALFIGPKP